MPGSGYRDAARAGAARRRADHPADPAAVPVLEAVDGRRTLDEIAEQVTATTARPVSGRQRRDAGRRQAAAARPAAPGRRHRARAEAVQPAARAAVQVRRHRPGADPPAHRRRSRRCSTRVVVVAVAGRVRLRLLVGAVRQGAGLGDLRGLRTSPACCCWSSRSPCSRPASTSSATPPPPAAAAPRPGVMGAGLYLVWPAFYTDVTDSYRLGRGGRLRTDLGGLYFNAIVAVGDRRRLVGRPGTTRCCWSWRRRSCRCCAS